LTRFIKKRKMEKAHRFFDRYGPWAVLLAAFTPIPYKVFTISAGLFYIRFKHFIIASSIGRGLRFFIVATLIMLWGEHMIAFFEKYFNMLTLIVGMVAVIAYAAYMYKKRKKK